MLKMSSTQINARTDTSDHGLSHSSKRLGTVANVLQAKKKRVGEVFPNFRLELNTLGILSDPTDENWKD